ncbi:MAG: hypothetical protein RR334_03080 [Clostridia bacterium]
MKKNVVIIFGGKTTEHDISIITAEQIMKGYTKEEFNILPIFITKSNEWLLSKKIGNSKFYKTAEKHMNDFTKVFLVCGSSCLYKKTFKGLSKYLEIHAIINACHGGDGENGNLTALVKMCNIPCSSGSTCAMSMFMDKAITKIFAKGLKIPVLSYSVFNILDYQKNKIAILEKLSALKTPLIVKPARQGSSIGIELAKNEVELENAINVAFQYDTKIIVEKGLTNFREFNVAVFGHADGDDENIIVSEIDEPTRSDEILTFSDKYMHNGKLKGKGMSGIARKTPTDIPANVLEEIKTASLKLFKMSGLKGVVRMDYLYDNDSKKWYFNETNTIPGSLGYYFYGEKRITRTALLEKLVFDAEFDFALENSLSCDYITDVIK